MLSQEENHILNLMVNETLQEPSEEYKKHSYLDSRQRYEALWKQSVEQPEVFWDQQAREHLTWFKTWHKVFEQRENHHFSWFQGGELNASYNCLDRQIEAGLGDQVALIWEGEPGDKVRLTFSELHAQVCRFANALVDHGIQAGDVITVYLPMVPELPITLLACARIGAVHNVVFAGFSAASLAERVENSKSKLVITADGGFRKGAVIPLKEVVDECRNLCNRELETIVVQRTKAQITMVHGRDYWWHQFLENQSSHHDAPAFDSEHPLFFCFTHRVARESQKVCFIQREDTYSEPA